MTVPKSLIVVLTIAAIVVSALVEATVPATMAGWANLARPGPVQICALAMVNVQLTVNATVRLGGRWPTVHSAPATD